jgi:hypothetical protein
MVGIVGIRDMSRTRSPLLGSEEVFMSERFPGAIQIGGAVPERLAPDLARAITEAGGVVGVEGAPATLQTREDLLAAADPVTGIFRLYDHEANYGTFPDLEIWLRDQGIAYDRQSDARYEFDGESVSFRPDLGVLVHTATQDGCPTVPLDALIEVRALLRAALVERSPEKVRSALAALDKVMGPDIPPLPPLRFIP